MKLIWVTFSQKFRVKVEDPPRRRHMVFLGGAVLANIMKDKTDFWITREEYKAGGLAGIQQKLTPPTAGWSAQWLGQLTLLTRHVSR